jgi:hypothetical protein
VNTFVGFCNNCLIIFYILNLSLLILKPTLPTVKTPEKIGCFNPFLYGGRVVGLVGVRYYLSKTIILKE